jgi:hypothetical protein
MDGKLIGLDPAAFEFATLPDIVRENALKDRKLGDVAELYRI